MPEDSTLLTRLTEWLRDGLIRIVEGMGIGNVWCEELKRLTGAVLAEADKQGGLAKTFQYTESAGNVLQTLARLCAMSGKERYLSAAETLATVHLSDPQALIRKTTFGDHGGELVFGLSELFALEGRLDRSKAEEYAAPLRKVLDRGLERPQSTVGPH